MDCSSFQLFLTERFPPLSSVELTVWCKLLQVIIQAVVAGGLGG